MTAEAPDAATRLAQFKQHFAAVLDDLQSNGIKDSEAMALLGKLAFGLSGNLGQQSWSAAKSAMTAEIYDDLLKMLRERGNEHHQAGETKHAYAIQVLAVSLVCRTTRADPQLASGEKLLDTVIDRTVQNYRTANQPKPN